MEIVVLVSAGTEHVVTLILEAVVVKIVVVDDDDGYVVEPW